MKLLALVVSELFQRTSLCDGGGGGGVDAICSRLEVDDDAISGQDVETFQ